MCVYLVILSDLEGNWIMAVQICRLTLSIRCCMVKINEEASIGQHCHCFRSTMTDHVITLSVYFVW